MRPAVSSLYVAGRVARRCQLQGCNMELHKKLLLMAIYGVHSLLPRLLTNCRRLVSDF